MQLHRDESSKLTKAVNKEIKASKASEPKAERSSGGSSASNTRSSHISTVRFSNAFIKIFLSGWPRAEHKICDGLKAEIEDGSYRRVFEQGFERG